VELRNRIFVPAHSTNFGSSEHHHPTPRHVNYHRERARGGVSLIITEGIRFFPPTWRKGRMGIFSDSDIDAFGDLVDAVHGEGTALFAQMNEPGRHMRLDRMAPVSSAGAPWMVGGPVPHAMTQEEIRVLVDAYGEGGSRIRRAGFDGLEVHFGHGHLLNQFLSPATNNRTDQFGGSEENRLRVPRACLEAVLDAVDCPVGLRITGDEFLEDGLGPQDMLRIIGGLLEEYPIAFVHVSHSFYSGEYSLATQVADMTFGPGPFLHLPRAFKEQFPETPVLAVCRIDDVPMAEELLKSGGADMAGMARAHITDPHLVRKAGLGVFEETRHCIACNQGCIGRSEFGWAISCVVNPEVGLEGQFNQLREAGPDESQRVLVIGGGPSGLEAAVSARRRGHDVTLVDAADRLGGQIRYASSLRGRDRIDLLVDELERDARREGVHIETGRRISADEVAKGDWDAVIVATGSRPRLPVYEGVDTVRSVWDAITDPASLGGHVVIVDYDGGWSGAGLAEDLAARDGVAVTIVTPSGGIGFNITVYSRTALYRRLERST
jgi:dimethylglycine catabolism A